MSRRPTLSRFSLAVLLTVVLGLGLLALPDSLGTADQQGLAGLAAGILVGGLAGLWCGQAVRRPVKQLRQAVAAIAGGNPDMVVPCTEDPHDIGDLARAIEVLRADAAQMAAQRWIKTHQAEIQLELQSATNVIELARIFLSTVCPLLKVGYGVFYSYEEDNRRLCLIGSYAFKIRSSFDQYFDLGQGLAGQCAFERSPITLTCPSGDYFPVNSSLIEAPPKAIAVFPVLRGERLMAVVELATLDDFGATQQALLDSVMPILAMSMEILGRTAKTEKLFEETAHQAARLQAQQEELQATEAWFRSIIESAPDGILVTDEAGTVILANNQIDEMFGYPEGELVGQSVEILVPEAVRGRHAGFRASYLKSATSPMMAARDRELLGVRRDGSSFPVEVGLSRLPLVGQRRNCICASVRNVSERKQAEKSLAHANMMSETALELTKAGSWQVPLDGSEVFLISERAAKVFGNIIRPDGRYHPTDEWAVNLFAADPVIAERTLAHFADACAGRVPRYDVTYPYKRPIDGRVVWIHALGHVVRDDAGKPLAMYGVSQDVTDITLAEGAALQAQGPPTPAL